MRSIRLLASTVGLLIAVLHCCKCVGYPQYPVPLATIVSRQDVSLPYRGLRNNFTAAVPLNESLVFIEKQHTKFIAESQYDVHEIMKPTFSDILHKAQQAAFRGGLYASLASCLQVVSLMWLKTTINYQYRYGGTLLGALKRLYRQGGIARFYKGITYALVLGPLSKFGSTAANEGARTFIYSNFGHSDSALTADEEGSLGRLRLNADAYMLASALGTVLSVMWRLMLMPLETCKTVLQVEGKPGFDYLLEQVLVQGQYNVLYRGSIASILVVITSHYPFFYMYNWLDNILKRSTRAVDIALRSAFIGFCASIASDACSNFMRILKTVKQSSLQEDHRKLTYFTIVQRVYVEGGVQALLGRGLMTRILANCLHNMFFVVFWKLIPHFLRTARDR